MALGGVWRTNCVVPLSVTPVTMTGARSCAANIWPLGVVVLAVQRSNSAGSHVGQSRRTASRANEAAQERLRKSSIGWARIWKSASGRSGFLTSAARNRASIFKMADQSRHKSLDVLRAYVRDQERFEDHAAKGLLQKANTQRRGK